MPSCCCAEIGLMLSPPTWLPGDRLSASTVTHEGHPLYSLSLPVSFFCPLIIILFFWKASTTVNKLWQLAKEALAVHTISANSLGARNDKFYSAVKSTFFYLLVLSYLSLQVTAHQWHISQKNLACQSPSHHLMAFIWYMVWFIWYFWLCFIYWFCFLLSYL